MKVLNQMHGDNYSLYHGDSVELLKGLPSNSVGLTVTSVPFAGMYTYTASARDVGNNKGTGNLVEHLKYIMEGVHDVTMDGRLCCIHLVQEPIFKWEAGYIGRVDFRGEIIRMMQKIGWIYWSEISIFKNPSLKAVRTKASTLSQAGTHKDMTNAAPCMLDYVVVFKKMGSCTRVNTTQPTIHCHIMNAFHDVFQVLHQIPCSLVIPHVTRRCCIGVHSSKWHTCNCQPYRVTR